MGGVEMQRVKVRKIKMGVFKRVFNALSDDPDFEYVFVDGTIVQAHQKASGARGDLETGHWPFPRGFDEQDSGGHGRSWLSCALCSSSGAGSRPRRHAGPA